ncbi:MAG: bifunctional diaminohydroxyphosphoribosylaminopyrimidine deaminase/5-amino-6-(5-phosphoribosylamino)uracil reductase RibD [Gammaproteobacteria bacterium]|nr:bifunctional diaminohydroxyphosphoribosylaminopyrimidine deaminase/5-amino-6-(5-phosphoribosylamino)uracil reductase RibD [Gammaproteobacteria bacterium]
MTLALRLAARGMYTTAPNPRVGCVVVRDGQVIGEGWHRRAGEPHAEVLALQQAGGQARGSTVYVTLEPCAHHGRTPPCCDALVDAKVARVVVAMTDPNPRVSGRGLTRLCEVGIEVVTGVCEQQARELNPGFIKRMEQGRPWLRCKLAMSLDGRTAMATGQSQWITAEPARRDVQHWRACSDAILTGIGTVLQDDPRLTVRHELLDGALAMDRERQPLRVVVDSRLRLPRTARLLQQPGPVLIVTAARISESELIAWQGCGAEVASLPDGSGRVDLPAVLQLLGDRGINEVQVEAGAVLSGALLQAGLLDELLLYIAPRLLGSAARGLFDLPGLQHLQDAPQLQIIDSRALGVDWRIRARPVPATAVSLDAG